MNLFLRLKDEEIEFIPPYWVSIFKLFFNQIKIITFLLSLKDENKISLFPPSLFSVTCFELLLCIKHWDKSKCKDDWHPCIAEVVSHTVKEGRCAWRALRSMHLIVPEAASESITEQGTYVKTKKKKLFGPCFFPPPLKCNLENELWDTYNNEAMKGGAVIFSFSAFSCRQNVFNFCTMVEIFLPTGFFQVDFSRSVLMYW